MIIGFSQMFRNIFRASQNGTWEAERVDGGWAFRELWDVIISIYYIVKVSEETALKLFLALVISGLLPLVFYLLRRTFYFQFALILQSCISVHVIISFIA